MAVDFWSRLRISVPSFTQARPIHRILLLVVAFALLVMLRFSAGSQTERNSDDANNFLAGLDMAHGNLNLHGWALAPDNYVPTDVLGMAVLSLIFGPRPVLMQVAEALIWAGIIMVAVVLATRGLRARPALIAATVPLTVLALTVQQGNPAMVFLSNVASHGFTILLALCGFWIVVSMMESAAKPARTKLLGLGIVALAGSFADPIFLVVGCGSIITTCFLRLHHRGNNRTLILICGVILAAIVLGRVLLGLNQLTGGFQLIGLHIGFARFDEIPGHIVFAAHSFTRLMGAEFFDRVVTTSLFNGPFIFMLRFPFLLVFLFAVLEVGMQVLRTIRSWPNLPARLLQMNSLDHLLWTGLILCATSSIVTTVIQDTGCVRYFLPATVFGVILMARCYARVPLFALCVVVVFVGSSASEAVSIAHTPLRPMVGSADAWHLVAALEAHDLKQGYGGYWESSITTVLSKGHIKTLALIEDETHQLHPFKWFTNLDLYNNAIDNWTGKVFFLARDRPAPLEMSQAAVITAFGPPAEIWHVDDQIIDVYAIKPHTLATLAP